MRPVVLLLLPIFTYAFEPLTTAAIASAAAASIYGYFSYTHCQREECCDFPWVDKHGHVRLNKLYGQPLVTKLIQDATIRREYFSKPLSLSFHGPVGTGKTFLSTLISESLFKLGTKSRYVHFFSQTHHFPRPERILEYQDELRKTIISSLKKCENSVFIFDEFDKVPPGIHTTLVPFMENRGYIDRVNTKKATFIFLSNTGSKAIIKKSYELWKNGVDRNDFKLEDFENDLKVAVFNEDGAFKNSPLIKKELIDAYVPFLPLEETHIRKCIEDEYHGFHHSKPSKDQVNAILKRVTFTSDLSNLYAETGCKRIHSLTALI